MTDHFTLKEFTFSATALRLGIDNSIKSDAQIQTAHATLAGLERIRAFLGGLPTKLNSGYRCAALNRAIGGVVDNPLTPQIEQSQHEKCEAVDFTVPAFGGPREIVANLEDAVKFLGIDQLIYEGTWVHASFTLNPRYQVLSLHNGKYLPGLV